VPRQISTGDRTILGRISKRGNSYLRMLFVQAARVVLLRPANWPKHNFGQWLEAAVRRMSSPRHSPTSSLALPGACCTTVADTGLGLVPSSHEALATNVVESHRGLREEQEMRNGLAGASVIW
jgi:hypothetical protein